LAKMASARIHHRHGGVCGQLGAPAKERFGKLTDGRADDGTVSDERRSKRWALRSE
jgi:hypothetical protein